jgi:hypothetical protein
MDVRGRMNNLVQGAKFCTVGHVRVPKCTVPQQNCRSRCRIMAPTHIIRGRSALVSVASVDAVAEEGATAESNGGTGARMAYMLQIWS